MHKTCVRMKTSQVNRLRPMLAENIQAERAEDGRRGRRPFTWIEELRSRADIEPMATLTCVRLDGVEDGVGLDAHKNRLISIEMRQSDLASRKRVLPRVRRKLTCVEGPHIIPNADLGYQRSRMAGVREVVAKNS